MPERTPRTKSEKQAAVKTVMHEFRGGKLHSGSKHGPKVKNPKQAVAIAMSESNQAKPEYNRKAHFKGNPGFPSDPEAKSPPQTYAAHEGREKEVMGAGYEEHERGERNPTRLGSNTPHKFTAPPNSGSHSFGHAAHQRSGNLRMSGHSGAHRIGGKRK